MGPSTGPVATPMECPSCSTTFPDDATFCTSCGWKVAGDPIDRAAHNLMKVSKEVLDTSLRFVEKTAKAIEPAVDRTVKKIEEVTKPVVEKAKPAVKKAAEATKKAVDRGVKAGRKAVEKTAEVAETAAKKVRKRIR